MQYIMGIEGVGSRFSVAALAYPNGEICSAARLDQPLSLHTTTRPLLRAGLMRLMRAVLQPRGLTLDQLKHITVSIGLSGVTFDYNAMVDVPRLFARMGVELGRLICFPDTHIIFASHAQSRRGSVLTCSMGSMAYVATPEADYRIGGWGPAFGDEGSGYWMGRAALRKIGEEADRNEAPSILWEEILKFLNDSEKPLAIWEEHSIIWQQRCELFQQRGSDLRTAIFSFAHDLSLRSTAEWRTLASSLVIPLMRAWQKEDKAATAIVKEAAGALGQQFWQVCERAKVSPDHGPLVLYGGVFMHNPSFRALVQEHIERETKCRIRIISAQTPGTMRPVCGALLLALGGSEIGLLRLPSQDMVRRIVEGQAKSRYSGVLAND